VDLVTKAEIRLPGKVRVGAARLFVLLGRQPILLLQVAAVAVATAVQAVPVEAQLAHQPVDVAEHKLRVVQVEAVPMAWQVLREVNFWVATVEMKVVAAVVATGVVAVVATIPVAVAVRVTSHY
jgi:hypothetical protein